MSRRFILKLSENIYSKNHKKLKFNEYPKRNISIKDFNLAHILIRVSAGLKSFMKVLDNQESFRA